MNKEDIINECIREFKIIPKAEFDSKCSKKEYASSKDALIALLEFLPPAMIKSYGSALAEDSPFLSNDLTAEPFVEMNQHFSSYNNLTLLYSILVYALKLENYHMVAALVFLVDRASYRYGNSQILMKIVELARQQQPNTHIAPQVIIRKARLMKDSGDLHGAMQTLEGVLQKEFKWDYKNENQYMNVKATCVQIKGQIFHNLCLWMEAIGPLLESVEYLKPLEDVKGISYSYNFLTKCLSKFTPEDFLAVKTKYPDFFTSDNPYHQGYILSVDGVNLVSNMHASDHLFQIKHQISGDECLLMYADQQKSLVERYNLHQTIIDDLKKCLAMHNNAHFLRSTEQCLQFTRAVFMISETLSFSRLQQDKCLSRYLEQLTIELYNHLCTNSEDRNIEMSVKFINGALTILGLPVLPIMEMKLMKVRSEDGCPAPIVKKESHKTAEVKYPTQPVESAESKSLEVPLNSSSLPSSGRYGGKLFSAKFPRKFIGMCVDPLTFYSSSSESEDFPKSISQNTSSEAYGEEVSTELVDISWATVSQTSGSDQTNLSDPKCFGIEEKSEATARKTDPPSIKSKDRDSQSEYRDSTSSSANSSSIFSAETVDIFSLKTTDTDDTDDECVSPLVDVNSREIHQKLSELDLGHSSASTSSSVEYLLNWELPIIENASQSSNISRAHLLTYNPVSSEWRSQSTLAYIGSQLQLGDKAGNFRDVYHIKFLHQEEPLGRYCCKKYRKQRDPMCYMQDIICQMVAGYYVSKFNEALASHKTTINVQFLPVAHLQLMTEEGVLKDWVNVEPFLHGEFNKMTNNWSFLNHKEVSTESKDLATALSHFSFNKSRGSLMIVDIQGWLPTNNKGIIYLTDPQFHTSTNIKRFSSCDRKQKGMDKFWKNVHKTCNSICHALNLKRP